MLAKPVIAAVEGYAVAGGLELALWCDLRVVASDATFGVFCRRWGVPLIDGGTVRLPRLIGHSHALDLILTGPGASTATRRCASGSPTASSSPARARDAAVALAADDSRGSRRRACASTGGRRTSSGRSRSTRRCDNELVGRPRGDPLGGAAVDRFVAGEGRHGARR